MAARDRLRRRSPPHRLQALTGKTVMVYGQTEVTRDLMDVREFAARRPSTRPQMAIHDIDTKREAEGQLDEGRRATRSNAISSPAATVTTASAARRCRRASCGHSSASIRSAGSASWSTSRRYRTN